MDFNLTVDQIDMLIEKNEWGTLSLLSCGGEPGRYRSAFGRAR